MVSVGTRHPRWAIAPTVKRLRRVRPAGIGDAQAKLAKSYEAAGIEFLDENGRRPGVRFRKPVDKVKKK